MLLGTRGRALLIGVAMSATVGIAVKYGATCAVARPTYLITIDPLLSDAHGQEITAFIQEQDIVADIGDFFEKIQEQFRVISDVAVTYRADGALHIDVQSAQPSCVANSDYVITKLRSIIPKNCFNEVVVQSLPAITVSQMIIGQQYIPLALQYCLAQIDSNLLLTYHLSYFDEHHVVLTNKDSQQAILFVSSNPPDERKIKQCEKIALQRSLNTPPSPKKKKGQEKKLIADVRFSHQIIMFGDTGGIYG